MKQTLARVISHVLGPELMWPLGVTLLIWSYSAGLERPIIVTLLLITLELILPLVMLVSLMKLGIVSDWEMTKREERRWFFIGILLLHACSVVTLYIWAPAALWQLRFILFVVALVITIITEYWKISAHLTVYTAIIGIVVILFGLQWWWLIIGWPLLIWARVVRRKHTFAQTLAGIIVTASIFSLGVYWLPTLGL